MSYKCYVNFIFYVNFVVMFISFIALVLRKTYINLGIAVLEISENFGANIWWEGLLQSFPGNFPKL